MKIYLVGGAIRDALLNLPIAEQDFVVVGATEAEMLKKKFFKVGKDFPVFLHPETKEEYALARTEKKIAKGYYGFACNADTTVTLEQDLERRDLTINAIAKDADGKLIDPFFGRQDLERRLLRHISNAFTEDPLRVLRVARFKAKLHHLGFSIAPETLELMRGMVCAGELAELTKERVWLEMYKALQEPSPQEFFLTLRTCNALEVIFPELNRLWGVVQNKVQHPEIDAGVHTMLVLEQAAKLTPDPKIRFACLCHDLGKGLTPKEQLPSHQGHEQVGVAIVTQWCNANRVPKIFRDFAVCVTKYHIMAHGILDDLQAAPAVALEILEGIDAFHNNSRLEQFIIACFADVKGRTGFADIQVYQQGEFLTKAYDVVKGISAEHLAFMQELKGKEIGLALTKLRMEAISRLLTVLGPQTM